MAVPSSPPPTDDTELRSSRRSASSANADSNGHGANGQAPSDPDFDGSSLPPDDPDAPLSFVPRTPLSATVRPEPLRVRTSRYGELEAHELVKLLDTIEDERARSRFRESVYLSIFFWIALALVVFFGPKYLWHAPRVVLPSEVLRSRELTQLTAPVLTAPRLRSAPPAVDNHTLEHLRSNEPKAPAAPPRPAEPKLAPRTETRPLPAAPTPNLQPATAPPNLPPAPVPQPVTPRQPTAVPDAPRPQPSRPNFNQVPSSAGDSIEQALNSARSGSGHDSGGVASRSRNGSDLGMGPAEILSDTQGVNFNPYLQRILHEIYDQWIPLIPEEARPPLMKQGVTMLRLRILPNGTIDFIGIDGSTHDQALNRAAWGSITGVGQFPPLPSQFHGPNLELRIHYLVNQKTE